MNRIARCFGRQFGGTLILWKEWIPAPKGVIFIWEVALASEFQFSPWKNIKTNPSQSQLAAGQPVSVELYAAWHQPMFLVKQLGQKRKAQAKVDKL